ncbi:hypothetical protein NAT51_10305 [Flavobacterium amniphilum]|uniref:hypothetical protein n=1 Tax=Flavobacterium amniphilum TaxID=1834035 RepID=UPI00202A1AF4|nr:hypothetical protein [Flavobacterium amniphilum]MCL9805916.1 hypothetical protein [Flavobacterium amniphilum]
MIAQNLNTSKNNRFSLLMSTLLVALFIVISLNIVFILFFTLKNMNQPLFDILTLTFKEGYLLINDEKVGFSVFANLLILFVLWIVMIYSTLRAINRNFSTYFL